MCVRALGCLVPLLLGACTSAQPPQPEEQRAVDQAPAEPMNIVTDGRLDDWPDGVRVLADGRWLHIVLDPPGPARTLQSSPTSTLIGLDFDQDLQTGSRTPLRGAELIVELSPRRQDAPPGWGVRVRSFETDGEPNTLGHAGIGFSFSPTYAAERYEARIDRLSLAGLRAPRPIRVQLALGRTGDGGPFIWRTMLVDLPPTAARAAWEGAAITPRRASELRIVSWNVLKGSPASDPEPFARVLRTLDPDVVLVQEWDGFDGQRLSDWFGAHIGGRWQAHANPGSGVGVVFKGEGEIEPLVDRVKMGSGWPTRLAAALVPTEHGRVLVASTHLKCCGSANSDEERRRTREAGAIAQLLRTLSDTHKPVLIVIGGDLNLVGSRKPLEIIGSHTDTDGSDLAIAEPRVPGGDAAYTWSDDTSRFSPGRLDWVLVGDERASIVRAFVVDARTIGEDALKIAGIERTDTSTSDHLPVVVDIKFD